MNDTPDIRHGDAEAGHRIMRLAGGAVYNPQGETCIARYKDGKLLGGIVYGSYTRRSLEMHVAGFAPRWLNRDLLWMAFDYPFVQLGCEKVFSRVQDSNEATKRFITSLGYSVEAVLKDAHPDGDALIFSMYKKDCRHLNIRPRGISRNERMSHG